MQYVLDQDFKELLLSDQKGQVMMEWEQPYMEACIDLLKPRGDVLEVGFGCGYSANHIQTYNPKSHTIVECDPIVLQKLDLWAKDKSNVKIVKGRWQEVIQQLGIFDEIFMDDFPLEINKDSSQSEILLSRRRFRLFIDICIQNHTKIGSKISGYLNSNDKIQLSSDSEPFVKIESKSIDIDIPMNCKYQNVSEQVCKIPLITKIKKFDFYEASRCALIQLKNLKGIS
jgi:guanidinoacetate N-methyltransferase